MHKHMTPDGSRDWVKSQYSCREHRLVRLLLESLGLKRAPLAYTLIKWQYERFEEKRLTFAAL